MKYKVRRAEALSKLSSSKENLLRINDIIVEVKRQINSLDRLAKKAERYKRLLDEFRGLDLRNSPEELCPLQEHIGSSGCRNRATQGGTLSQEIQFFDS